MNEPKPLASLSPTLLARKGGAKPAMRRQMHYPDSLARTMVEDDLGWNDMGEEDHAPQAGQAEAGALAGAGEVVPIKAMVELPVVSEKPAVLQHREAIAEQVAPFEPQASKAIAAPRRSALNDGRRAAFTLRMDAERHLKLRLACTIRNRSAQQLVTEALDRLIDELPDLATLAAQVAKRR
ncbi:MAG: hypothetical protein QM676_03710 [Novosphingobium sp.]